MIREKRKVHKVRLSRVPFLTVTSSVHKACLALDDIIAGDIRKGFLIPPDQSFFVNNAQNCQNLERQGQRHARH